MELTSRRSTRREKSVTKVSGLVGLFGGPSQRASKIINFMELIESGRAHVYRTILVVSTGGERCATSTSPVNVPPTEAPKRFWNDVGGLCTRVDQIDGRKMWICLITML